MKNNNVMHIGLAAYLDKNHGRFNLWWQGTFLMLGLFALTLLLWWIDPRQLDGGSVWAKPLKFEVSVILYFITLSLLASFLPAISRNSTGWRWATRIAVSAGVLEVLYIFLQAARGRASHFNESTPLEAMLYGLMGLGAVLMIATSAYLGWLLYRSLHQGEPRILKSAAAWGLILGSLLTLLTAGAMSAHMSHFVSAPAADAWTLPVFGWSLGGGDLRIPHFFAMHLIQFLPLYGWWLQRKDTHFDTAQLRLWVFALLYCVVVVAWFANSFLNPLI